MTREELRQLLGEPPENDGEKIDDFLKRIRSKFSGRPLLIRAVVDAIKSGIKGEKLFDIILHALGRLER